MKQCPNCRKVYGDDLSFCLDDGFVLQASVTNAAPDTAFSGMKTEVLQPPFPITQPTAVKSSAPTPRGSSPVLYVVIAVLLIACAGLIGFVILLNSERFKTPPASSAVTPANNVNSETARTETTPVPPKNANTSPAPQSETTIEPAATYNASGRWKGNWSTASGTLFDFELSLAEGSNNSLDGQVKWTMRRTARSDKADKVGFSAIEFVRGNYDPSTGVVSLTGYNKDDPNGVLVMLDVYRLKVSKDGRSLTGQARNGGKWNGNVDLKR